MSYLRCVLSHNWDYRSVKIRSIPCLLKGPDWRPLVWTNTRNTTSYFTENLNNSDNICTLKSSFWCCLGAQTWLHAAGMIQRCALLNCLQLDGRKMLGQEEMRRPVERVCVSELIISGPCSCSTVWASDRSAALRPPPPPPPPPPPSFLPSAWLNRCAPVALLPKLTVLQLYSLCMRQCVVALLAVRKMDLTRVTPQRGQRHARSGFTCWLSAAGSQHSL